MRKLVLFMHTSLDGFVAGPNREIDWVSLDDNILDYAVNQIDRSDTALYGRVTYQLMQDYWPAAGDKPNVSKHDKQHSDWYKQVNKVVLSRTLQGMNSPNFHVISDNLSEQILKLKQEAGKDIVMFGSPGAADSLMKENLVDDFRLFINPILLGQGIPLFRGAKEKVKLKLAGSSTSSSGVICLHYEKK